MPDARILPPDLIRAVDSYIDGEIEDAAKYENREPFDQSGVWSLQQLAALIYRRGWEDGEYAEGTRNEGERRRDRNARRDPKETRE